MFGQKGSCRAEAQSWHCECGKGVGRPVVGEEVGGGGAQGLFRNYARWCVWEPYGIAATKPRTAMCTANTLPILLLLWPRKANFLNPCQIFSTRPFLDILIQVGDIRSVPLSLLYICTKFKRYFWKWQPNSIPKYECLSNNMKT